MCVFLYIFVFRGGNLKEWLCINFVFSIDSICDNIAFARPFKLKWGKFASACYTCNKFGHMQSECPTLTIQPPENHNVETCIIERQ